MDAIHPGVKLKALLDKLEIPYGRFGEHIGLSKSRVSKLLNGKKRINALLALKLSDCFPYDAKHWMEAQTLYDIAQAKLKYTRKSITPLTTNEFVVLWDNLISDNFNEIKVPLRHKPIQLKLDIV